MLVVDRTGQGTLIGSDQENTNHLGGQEGKFWNHLTFSQKFKSPKSTYFVVAIIF